MPIIIDTENPILPLQNGSSAGHDSKSPNLQAGESTDASSMIVELDTEGNQDPDLAEVDTAAAHARQDMNQDLTGVGGMFSDNAPHIDPVLNTA